MKNPCPDKQDMIADLVSQVLTPPQAKALHGHLDACEPCRDYWESLQREEKELSDYFDSLAPGPERTIEAIQQQSPVQPAKPHFIWRTLMANKATQVAAVILLVAGIIGLGLLFTPGIGGSGIAFADVLEYFRGSGYTFTYDITIGTEGSSPFSAFAQILEPGRIRIDTVVGSQVSISTIADVSQGKALIIFHQQKAVQIMESKPVSSAEEGGGVLGAMYTRPIETLWDLVDGSEERLGKREIEGQPAEGFRVVQEDQRFRHETTIWAHAQTGAPILVESTTTLLDGSGTPQVFTMRDFELKVELDESLFSMIPPAGYTLANQVGLEEVSTGEVASPAGAMLEEALELWSADSHEEAVEMFMDIDWTGNFQFSQTSYYFTLTEKEYISLKEDDRNKVMNDLMEMGSTIRGLARHLRELSEAKQNEDDYEQAARHMEAIIRFGNLIKRDSEGMLVAVTVGHAIKIMGLKELVELHTESEDQGKLREARTRLEVAQTQYEVLKRKL